MDFDIALILIVALWIYENILTMIGTYEWLGNKLVMGWKKNCQFPVKCIWILAILAVIHINKKKSYVITSYINISTEMLTWQLLLWWGPSWLWWYVSWIYWCCEFESRSGQGVQHYLIKFVGDLRQVSGFLRFPPPIKLTATI
jgi:hypothetical protein